MYDVRTASAEVNGEKLAELTDGRSLVFTKAGLLTGAALCPLRPEGNRVV
jgi:hypothetical protein